MTRGPRKKNDAEYRKLILSALRGVKLSDRQTGNKHVDSFLAAVNRLTYLLSTTLQTANLLEEDRYGGFWAFSVACVIFMFNPSIIFAL